MTHPFFPSSEFGWCFLAVLIAVLGCAAYQDFRFAIIPKWLTLPLLALGVIANMIRGAWLAYDGGFIWLDTDGSVFLGVLDGLLFALVGFIVGFGLLLVMWILGTCGGGDVKLFAGIGAWTGPIYVIFVLVGSMF